MQKIAIIVAMDKERELLMQSFSQNENIIVAKSGIGKVNAALCAQALIQEFQPDVIINTGVAGGCGPDIRPLDVVVAKECCYHDVWCGEPNQKGQIQDLPARFVADEAWLGKALSCGAKPVLICSGDIFAGKDDVKRIKADFPTCQAVDMESAAIAQVCYLNKVPFLSVRVISDNADGEDNAAQYADFWNLAPQTSFSFLQKLLS
jgi:adenosylhomocysteine nucleosidase